MALTLESGSSIQRYRGLSTDTKPKEGVILVDDDLLVDDPTERTIKPGSVYTEIDTGARFYWNGIDWIRQEQTLEIIFEDLSAQMTEMIGILKIIQAATATVANGSWGADIPTGRDN